MNAKKAKRSTRNKGYYLAQVAVTRRNKLRRLQRIVNRCPAYRPPGYTVTKGVVA